MGSALAEAVLRANPGYELVTLDHLTAVERELVDGSADPYGVLRPRPGTELALRRADSQTALLYLTLGEPGTLPVYVRRTPGLDANLIARLVLDGVLELNHDGEFRSGVRAGDAVFAGRAGAGRGRLGELSRAALGYAQELARGGLTGEALALRLYTYGTRPVTAALARRLGDPSALLGIGEGPARRALDAGWVQAPAPPAGRVHWRSWRARGCEARERAGHAQSNGYKLYVSPDIDAAGTAFAVVAGSLADARGISAFKVGAGLRGLCRPDKLVVYFDRLEDLQEGAAKLRDELAGCPAHGVPFAAAVTDDGLLAWAGDPPEAHASWRVWVSRRLADYLVQGACAAVEPSQFALERLRFDGIDTDTWIPAGGMWRDALTSG